MALPFRILESPMSRPVVVPLAVAVSMVLSAAAAQAGTVTVPNQFAAHTPAVAAQVNQNFAAVQGAVNGNAADIASLRDAVTALQNLANSQAAAIHTLQTQVQSLQSNSVLALDGKLGLTTVDGYPTAQFTAVNVRIVNGTNVTQSTNGLGNLTLGYNEADSDAPMFCSLGQYGADWETCTNHGGHYGRNQRTGSHNLIVGRSNAYTAWGGLVGGLKNVVSGGYSAVLGGTLQRASGSESTVAGGRSNVASESFASVAGGEENAAGGIGSSVAGGERNFASGTYAAIAGGTNNTASGSTSTVTGGALNRASGDTASISGGQSNTATGVNASVSGGYGNTAGGTWSSVSGGYQRSAPDTYNWAAGDSSEDN
jgi:hypothetical protein